MADPVTAKGTTNKQPDSHVTANCALPAYWAYAQGFSIMRLSTIKANGTLIYPTTYIQDKAIEVYGKRTKIIAATYARFYLEIEEGGDPRFKGRHYWMALGAFASKTVGCVLDTLALKTTAWVDAPLKTVDGLGKGNFWLFQDVSSSHFLYNQYPFLFKDKLIIEGPRVYDRKYTILSEKLLAWAPEALEKTKNLHISTNLLKAFEETIKFEKAKFSKINKTTKSTLERIQWNHLLAMANHEQRDVLQPLMYDDFQFAFGVKAQRWLSAITPALELVFSHECTTEDPKLKSVAPEDTVLENANSRMKWITLAAADFHNLMMTRTAYMENQLKIMAAWHTPTHTTAKLRLQSIQRCTQPLF